MVAASKGSNIASAATIVVTHDFHHVTGSTTISTITPPSPDFCGKVILVCDDASLDYQTGGNIARLVNSVIHVAQEFIYDPGNSLWYPVSVP